MPGADQNRVSDAGKEARAEQHKPHNDQWSHQLFLIRRQVDPASNHALAEQDHEGGRAGDSKREHDAVRDHGPDPFQIAGRAVARDGANDVVAQAKLKDVEESNHA
jgi:hypothetical protein